MKIIKITSQNRRDFWADYECEHCKFTHNESGYDDSNFHDNCIPDMECPKCKKKAKDYRPLKPKYNANEVI